MAATGRPYTTYRRRPLWRPVWLAALAVAAGGAAFLLLRQAGPAPAEASAPHKATSARRLLSITSELPDWLAPGAPLVLRGWAGRNVHLTLRANGRPVAATVSGPLGAYELRFAVSKPGRYVLAVQSSGDAKPVGSVTVRPVVIEAVGDITFGEQVGTTIAQYGAAYPWTYVARTLRAADITVGNLETAVSTRGVAVTKQYVFRGEASALRPIGGLAGFDVLTLANNHTVDYGPDALLDTIRSVRAAGIQSIGAGSDESQARRPAYVEAGGLRIAFLGYSDVNPLGFPAGPSTAGTARADTASIATDVHAARRHSDVVVCFFHWGIELHPEPDSRQQLFAAACLNAGAKIVLGAHPHVLGPVTRPTPSTLVAWSLGNFVFPSAGVTARTAILRMNVDRRGARGYRLLPVAIEGFTPRLVSP
jgi:Bacterial capsule synthesis protein PGA_cap